VASHAQCAATAQALMHVHTRTCDTAAGDARQRAPTAHARSSPQPPHASTTKSSEGVASGEERELPGARLCGCWGLTRALLTLGLLVLVAAAVRSQCPHSAAPASQRLPPSLMAFGWKFYGQLSAACFAVRCPRAPPAVTPWHRARCSSGISARISAPRA